MKLNLGLTLVAIAAVGALGYVVYNQVTANPLPEDLAFGNGRIEAVQVDISSKIPGRVSVVEAREGDLVQKDQQLALIDTRELDAQLARARAQHAAAESRVIAAQATVAQAEARLLLAEQELKRTKSLVERRVATPELLDTRRSDQKVAAANLDLAQATLLAEKRGVDAAAATIVEVQTLIDDASLTAPTFGRVLYRLVEPGEIVAGGGRVMTLVDLSEVYLEFYIPAYQVHRIAIGAEARIKLDIAPFVIPAQVSFVSPVSQFTPKQVETESERHDLMFRVKVRVPQELVEANIDQVKTGMRGVAYVRLAPAPGVQPSDWPEELDTLPPGFVTSN